MTVSIGPYCAGVAEPRAETGELTGEGKGYGADTPERVLFVWKRHLAGRCQLLMGVSTARIAKGFKVCLGCRKIGGVVPAEKIVSTYVFCIEKIGDH